MTNDKKKTTANEALSTEAPASERSWTRWILPTVGLVALIFLGLVIRDRLQSEVWSYYTDEEGLRVDVQEKKERMVLWEDPQQSLFKERAKDPENPGAVDPVNQASQSVEAAFSADGRHWTKSSHAPLNKTSYGGRSAQPPFADEEVYVVFVNNFIDGCAQHIRMALADQPSSRG